MLNTGLLMLLAVFLEWIIADVDEKDENLLVWSKKPCESVYKDTSLQIAKLHKSLD